MTLTLFSYLDLLVPYLRSAVPRLTLRPYCIDRVLCASRITIQYRGGGDGPVEMGLGACAYGISVCLKCVCVEGRGGVQLGIR